MRLRHYDSEVSGGRTVGSESTNSTLPFRRILWAALFMHPMVTLKRCANALSVRLFRICKARYNSTSPSAESVPDPKGRPRLRLSLLMVAFLQFAPLLGIHLAKPAPFSYPVHVFMAAFISSTFSCIK